MMNAENQKTIVYYLAGALLVVGVVCYAAFPDKQPDEPLRILLKNTAGNVIFDHQTHTSDEGYGLEDCTDCHHMWEDDGTMPQQCGECHYTDMDDPLMRKDAFHNLCTGCHEEDGTAPVECADCHAL
jgi:hypothetical protein